MLDNAQLLKLSTIVAKRNNTSPVAYSFGEEKFNYEECEKLFNEQMKELAGDYNSYRRNQVAVFELIEKTIDEVLPVKVKEQFGIFAETQQVAQGDKYIFRQRITEAAKKRAKQFVTRVGLAGVYEVFILGGAEFEVKTNAIGGACQIAFEEYLDGQVTWADVYDVLMEGMQEYIMEEIIKALQSLLTSTKIPTNNKQSHGGFSEAKMDKILSIADSYSTNGKSTIFCTFEFAATMLPTTTWSSIANYSNEMKNELWQKGYFTRYKDHDVVIIKQSMLDATNTTKAIDPSYAWVLPNGGDGKPVKIVFEGDTKVREIDVQGDWSRHLDTYKKVGVGLITVNPGICVYRNTNLNTTV